MCTTSHALRQIGVKAQRWLLSSGSGIDTQLFIPVAKSSVVPRIFRFLFVGRILIDKGVTELFMAWQQIQELIPNASLKHRPLRPTASALHSKNLARRAGLTKRVHYGGHQEDEESFMGKCDIVVLPSYREGFSRTLMEALAMATPIIATDEAGCKELAIPNLTGWRIPAHSSAALAEAMLEAYHAKPDVLSNMGTAGRQLIEDRYNEQVIGSQDQLVRELIPDEQA
ncbi:MAG: glycosyltransferase [Saprospiraceae bacterium]